jgi:DMSO/TMAO reductase YedYZ molybdopterin-dependent catalytic subunit
MRWRPWLAGLVTGAVGLAVAIAASALLRLRLDPVNAVAETVIDVTPGRVAKLLIDLVGQWDKPLLLAGTVIGLAVLSGLAGRLGAARLRLGQALFLAMGLFAGLCVQSRPESALSSFVPVLAGTVAWVALLPVLLPREEAVENGPGYGRRLLLAGAGGLVVGLVGGVFGRKRREVERAIADLDLPVTPGRVPAGADLAVPQQAPWRTPNGDFYRIDTALAVPAIAPADWRLRVTGMVDRELELTYDDLVERQLTEAWVTLCCVSNEVGGDLIGNAWWSGVRVADVLAEAGVQDGADAVKQTSDDGWTCGTPLEALTDDRDALLALAMNGRPLPVEHGFPVRMVVPGLYGYVSATKWVTELEVTRFDDFSAFWTDRGWGERGPVRTQSRVDVPRANDRITAGDVVVAGVAWAQHTGVERVEVQLDGGGWREVDLARVPTVDTWVQWRGVLPVEPGAHRLAVRATDRSGYTQTGARRDVVPDGATGWHTIDFTAK